MKRVLVGHGLWLVGWSGYVYGEDTANTARVRVGTYVGGVGGVGVAAEEAEDDEDDEEETKTAHVFHHLCLWGPQ